MKDISVLAIDIAKQVFQLHGANASGRQVYTRRVRRAELLEQVLQLNPRRVVMESCGGSHYWGRAFESHGIKVDLIAAQHVKPFVKTNKTDRADARAIAEASLRPDINFVQIKSEHQQSIMMIHRLRERLVKNRTALSNEVKGFLCEFGVVLPKGLSSLKMIPELLEKQELPAALKRMLGRLYEEFCLLNKQIALCEEELKVELRSNEKSQKLEEVPGFGLLTVTALANSVPNPKNYRNGRQFAASLGLVPRQHSSAERIRLGAMSKRGDVYLRTLLIHGARSIVRCAGRKNDAFSMWVNLLVKRVGYNKAVVAVANKNARIAWALLAHDKPYCAQLATAQ